MNIVHFKPLNHIKNTHGNVGLSDGAKVGLNVGARVLVMHRNGR